MACPPVSLNSVIFRVAYRQAIAALVTGAEIQGRVAAFRAHQQAFLRERDAYFHAVLEKARGSADFPSTGS